MRQLYLEKLNRSAIGEDNAVAGLNHLNPLKNPSVQSRHANTIESNKSVSLNQTQNSYMNRGSSIKQIQKLADSSHRLLKVNGTGEGQHAQNQSVMSAKMIPFQERDRSLQAEPK